MKSLTKTFIAATIIGASLANTPALAFSAHSSAHSSAHVSSHSSSHVSSHSSVHESSGHSSSHSTSSHTEPSHTTTRVNGKTVYESTKNHAISTPDSHISTKNSFYKMYTPRYYSNPNWFQWVYLSMFHNDSISNIKEIKGKVLSKESHNRVTIKTKYTGKVQVTLGVVQYNNTKVGDTITVKETADDKK